MLKVSMFSNNIYWRSIAWPTINKIVVQQLIIVLYLTKGCDKLVNNIIAWHWRSKLPSKLNHELLTLASTHRRKGGKVQSLPFHCNMPCHPPTVWVKDAKKETGKQIIGIIGEVWKLYLQKPLYMTVIAHEEQQTFNKYNHKLKLNSITCRLNSMSMHNLRDDCDFTENS